MITKELEKKEKKKKEKERTEKASPNNSEVYRFHNTNWL